MGIPNQPEPTFTFDFANETWALPIAVETGEITMKETTEAVIRLKNNKAAWWVEITGEMLKHGGEDLVTRLTRLLNKCWREQVIPKEWQQGVKVKLPKKGDASDYNDWRGITVISVARKVLCRILLQRFRASIDLGLQEEHAEFRAGRSCPEQIFTLCNILEQCKEYQS